MATDPRRRALGGGAIHIWTPQGVTAPTRVDENLLGGTQGAVNNP